MIEKTNLVISFSGGETSAYMTKMILEKYREMFNEIVVIFANTGQENDETLEFVDQCDKAFGFNVVWVEANVFHGIRKSSGFHLVNFETASRDGKPYEEVIKKYGIPNKSFSLCTRELKLNPIKAYINSLGWYGHYTAVGIRNDETRRISKEKEKLRIIYPLIDLEPTTKPEINTFWREQPFRLKLTGYQGNCKWCWKKSLRKLLTIYNENPSAFDFPLKMEEKYGRIGPEFVKRPDANNRTFFRENMSTKDIIWLAENKEYDKPEDDSIVYNDKNVNLDLFSGCEESCEVY